MVMGFHRRPSVGDAFLFAGGALLGFGLLGSVAQHELSRREPSYRGRERVLAGVLNWLSVGAAVGAVALLAQIPGWVVWPLASFTATVAYLSVLALQLVLVATRDGPKDDSTER